MAYLLLFFTKIVFYFYLKEDFFELSLLEVLYATLWGYKFDFAAAAVVAFLATLFDWSKRVFTFVSAFLLLGIFALQMGDILYFHESSRHIGYEITDTLTDANSLFMTAYSQHISLTFIAMILGVILFYFFSKWLIRFEKILLNKSYLVKKLLLIVLTVFFIRGMFQGIPLNPWQANQIGESKLAILSLNAVYNVVYVLANSKKKLQALSLPKVSQEEIEKAFLELYSDKELRSSVKKLENPNIVFLFLESWSAVNMKSYGYPKTTTPFFDALLEKSVHPIAMMAGGHRTTEGLFATLTSLQNPLGRSVAKTNLQSFSYPSIIKILKEKKGYSSAFFQGSSKETSGTGSLAQDLGFTESYGKRDVLNREYKENAWGVHDFDLYDFSLERVKEMKKPFVIGINGATTHDDKIPNGIKSMHFSDDKAINGFLNAVHFADMALEKFVKETEEQYPNTLFVLFADHCGGVRGTAFQNYLIPFALYHKALEPKAYEVILSQRDIAPTVYDLVVGDYKADEVGFSGKSLLSDQRFFADYYYSGTLGWVEENKVLELNIATGKERCFEIVNFKNSEVKCSNDIMAFKQRALSFTEVSQKLLFSGKSEAFINYRK
jgi:phosphoglycerol transferase MdoB-like AlkP superfamily enzyme